MVCTLTCAIASAFLGAMLWVMFNTDKNLKMEYKMSMTVSQLEKKKQIKQMRMNIWLAGMACGLILAGAYLYFYGNTVSTNQGACVFAAIAMTVNYLVYQLWPKSDFMIHHLRPDQIGLWKQVGTMYKRNYYTGAVIGLIGCYLLGVGLLNRGANLATDTVDNIMNFAGDVGEDAAEMVSDTFDDVTEALGLTQPSTFEIPAGIADMI
jgi:hypothetical protein